MTEQKLCAKRHVVALAVAAALLAASGAAAADPVNYDRITTSIDQPDQDAAVTYTDDTGETIVGLTPVIPGDGVDPSSGITLTLKSLTVSNTTTAGETGETGRNGDAISTGTQRGLLPGKTRRPAACTLRCLAMCLLPREPARSWRPITTISMAQSAAI